MSTSPTESFLQFGTGNFLRSFIDLFVSEENRAGRPAGRIVAVQSTGEEKARALNARECRYHVAIRGFSEGQVVDEIREVESLTRVLVASSQWSEILKTATSPDLRWVVSNVTEAGLALAEADRPEDAPPASFPAKLLLCLKARHDSGLQGMTILPCELVPDNAMVVRDLVLKQASLWNLDGDFLAWLRNSCRWVSTLVDRIVPGVPENHPMLSSDPLLLSAEPYALWALQGRRDELPLTDHPAVVTADDITPYALRKVRILNGAHTALVAKAMPMGIRTVREAVEHPEVGPWLRRLLFEEIVPTLQRRVVDPEGFAQATLDRFANPFLNHNLADIAKGHEGKVALRLAPTLSEFRERFGKEPPILAELLQNSAR